MGKVYLYTPHPLSINEEEIIRVGAFYLSQNYPNPFNPQTRIDYSIQNDGLVKLKVYDILGNEVATLVNERNQPGNYSTTLDAASLPSGIYIYRIVSGNFQAAKKMILLK